MGKKLEEIIFLHTRKRNCEKSIMLSCAKRGYVSVKAVERKTLWTKQKIIALGQLLMEDEIFTYRECDRHGHVKGFYLR